MSASIQRARPPAARRAATITGLRALVPALTLAAGFALAMGATTATTGAQSASQRATALVRATRSQPVEIELRSAARVLVPGETASVAIRFRPEPGWHMYWRHAGDVGSPPSMAWQLPDGFTAGPLRWPTPELIVSPPLASYGYEREVHLLTDIHVPSSAQVGSTATLAGTVTWVVCRQECFAADVDLALTLPVGAAPEADTAAARAIAAEDARVPVRRRDWAFRSAVDAGTIVLRVRPPGGAGLLAPEDAARARFFVDSSSVIDHAAPAAVRVDGDELELRLERSQYASGLPTRLTGVLVLAGRGSDDEGFALEVDAPVVSMAQLASADAGTGDATLAGGGWLALATAGLLALVGGTLLNLMPCVLPVLSIKALGVAESAAQDARTARRHTLLFAAGVLVSMWALVGTLLALRAAGAEVGWGFQLQSPAVVGGLALLVFAAALNMAGVFELAPVGGTLSVAASRTPPAVEAFLSGVLVTVLATPCSAPFLAAAVAYGIAGGAASAFVVFTALGLGLVWPLALVAVVPRVRAWLPRPGAWMVTLRQALAFPLLATVVWLAWVLGRQAGVDAVAVLLAALTLLAFGLWSLGRFATLVASPRQRGAARGVALAAGAGALALVMAGARSAPARDGAATGGTSATARADGALPWRPYSEATLTALRDSGRVVLLDFTADWCLTCKVNERVAFGSDTVRATLRAHDVVLLRADWTTRDPSVTRALAAFSRNSVPFVVLYGRDRAAPPVVLPTLLTPGIVTRALDAAAAGRPPVLSAVPAR